MSDSGNSRSTSAWEVTRRLKIPAMDEAADERKLIQGLTAVPGVRSVVAEADKQRLEVRYAASETDYRAITHVLAGLGYPVATDRWSTFKGSWYQFTDINARENAEAPEPACCNKAPRRPRD